MRKRWYGFKRGCRTFWWMVVRPEGDNGGMDRRVWLGIALREALCGALTGRDHWWSREYRRRDDHAWSRKCRLCRATAHRLDPLTPDEQRQHERWAKEFLVKPTEEDAKLAVESLREHGLMRGEKFLWE